MIEIHPRRNLTPEMDSHPCPKCGDTVPRGQAHYCNATVSTAKNDLPPTLKKSLENQDNSTDPER